MHKYESELYEEIVNGKRSDSGIQGARLTIYPRSNGNFDIGSTLTVEKNGDSKTTQHFTHATDLNGGEVLHQLAFLLADIHVPREGTHAR